MSGEHTFTRPCPACDQRRREHGQTWRLGLGCVSARVLTPEPTINLILEDPYPELDA